MTKDELKKARGERTQQQMADILETPVSTYRKWEQGERKVPVWVEGRLSNKKLAVEHLSTTEMLDFIKRTNNEGLDADEVIAGLIREWMTRTLAVLLFAFMGWQISLPREDSAARLIGRRREGAGAAEMVGEA